MTDRPRFFSAMQIVECYKVPYTPYWHVKAEGINSTLLFTNPSPMQPGTYLVVTAEEGD